MTAPFGNSTGLSVSKIAVWVSPSRGSIDQAVFGSPSMAASIGQPPKLFCEKLAAGLRSTMVLGGAVGLSFGTAVTENSLSAKLPLYARPGPCDGSCGSAKTSRRIPVIPLRFVSAVTV